jgi:hypothetical protein
VAAYLSQRIQGTVRGKEHRVWGIVSLYIGLNAQPGLGPRGTNIGDTHGSWNKTELVTLNR